MTQDVITYIPPFWIHNRAIVRTKRVPVTEAVLKRYRAGSSKEDSTIVVVPLSPEGEPQGDGVATLIAVLESDYEPAGRIMSMLRAPL